MEDVQRDPYYARLDLDREARKILGQVALGQRPEPPPEIREPLKAVLEAEREFVKKVKLLRRSEGIDQSTGEVTEARLEYERTVDDAAARLSEFIEKVEHNGT